MFTIGQVAELTGVSSYTLRYYEKIGLLPPLKRNSGGIREYSDLDIRFVHFLNSLKKTGMSLEDITGCIVDKMSEGQNVHPSIEKRIEILTKHLERMEAQRKELEQIISLAKEKLSVYHEILASNTEDSK
ncbi:MerR family transcriptional regulator [Brevibacillus parabrevis]|jgi:Predicted transcriptional regulators|uniref:MerR family transcriptional regulator n=1 Tax=Brevibacillus parabrevis TaxID=54914 RepID=UPI002491ADBA|nr:MerR family transcriptional regulator [Brevibacillus parabrevis]